MRRAVITADHTLLLLGVALRPTRTGPVSSAFIGWFTELELPGRLP